MYKDTIKFIVGISGLAIFTLAAPGCDSEEDFDGMAFDEELEFDAEDEESFRAVGDYYDPVGTHDVANCNILAGWAKDGDSTAPLSVHFYKGSSAPWGQFVGATLADRYRGDLPFSDKNHGFSVATPAALKTGCPERVYIHAIDVTAAGTPVPGGNNKLLNLTGKTVVCGPPPPGGCYGGGPFIDEP